MLPSVSLLSKYSRKSDRSVTVSVLRGCVSSSSALKSEIFDVGNVLVVLLFNSFYSNFQFDSFDSNSNFLCSGINGSPSLVLDNTVCFGFLNIDICPILVNP